MLVKFEQNRVVQNIQIFEVFSRYGYYDYEESVDAILEDVSVT